MVLANLAVRFVLELVGVGALGVAAYQVPLDGAARIGLAAGASLAFVVVWAIVIAPKAKNPLTQPQRDAIGTGLLLLVAVALAATGQPLGAAVFGLVVLVNWLFGVALGQDAASVIRTGGRSR